MQLRDFKISSVWSTWEVWKIVSVFPFLKKNWHLKSSTGSYSVKQVFWGVCVCVCFYLGNWGVPGPATPGGGMWGVHATPLPPPTLVPSKKRDNKVKKEFKVENIKRLSPRSKCYFISHSRATRIQNFLVDQPWWLTMLFSVPWPLHFEINFTGPVFWIVQSRDTLTKFDALLKIPFCMKYWRVSGL